MWAEFRPKLSSREFLKKIVSQLLLHLEFCSNFWIGFHEYEKKTRWLPKEEFYSQHNTNSLPEWLVLLYLYHTTKGYSITQQVLQWLHNTTGSYSDHGTGRQLCHTPGRQLCHGDVTLSHNRSYSDHTTGRQLCHTQGRQLCHGDVT